MRTFALAAGLLIAACSTLAVAHGYKRNGIEIVHPWVLETKGPDAVVHMTIRNSGKSSDRLIGVTASETADARIVVSEGSAGGVIVPAGGDTKMGSEGPRIEFQGLKRPLSPYDRVALKLVFEKAGPLAIEVTVEAAEDEATAEPSTGAE